MFCVQKFKWAKPALSQSAKRPVLFLAKEKRWVLHCFWKPAVKPSIPSLKVPALYLAGYVNNAETFTDIEYLESHKMGCPKVFALFLKFCYKQKHCFQPKVQFLFIRHEIASDLTLKQYITINENNSVHTKLGRHWQKLLIKFWIFLFTFHFSSFLTKKHIRTEVCEKIKLLPLLRKIKPVWLSSFLLIEIKYIFHFFKWQFPPLKMPIWCN